jgi:hypothetical protein
LLTTEKDPQQLYIQFGTEYLPGKVGKDTTTHFAFTTCKPQQQKQQQHRHLLTYRDLACSEPLGFFGNGTASKLVSKEVEVETNDTIIAARGQCMFVQPQSDLHNLPC